MSQSLTLYEVESNLQALIDTEDVVPEEQLAEFAAELAEAGELALSKRDRCVQFIRHVEAQIAFSREEEARLAKRRKALEAGLARFREYVLRIVDTSGKQTSATIRRLKGRVGDLCAVQNPPSLKITDESAIPEAYRVVSITMTHQQFVELLDEVEGLPGSVACSIDNSAIMKALQAGEEVPGADLDISGKRLEIK